MKLTYLDAPNSPPVDTEGVGELIQKLGYLTQYKHIKFLNAPFPLTPEFFKEMKTHFSHQKLKRFVTFECNATLEDLQAENLSALRGFNFNRLTVSFILGQPFEPLLELLDQMESLNMALTLDLRVSEVLPADAYLCQLYLFLQTHGSRLILQLPEEISSDPKINKRFKRLAKISSNSSPAHRVQRSFNYKLYPTFYRYLTNKLSRHVKTVLEINPYCHQSFYQEVILPGQTWKITRIGLPEHALDHQALKALNKTFDAVLMFQALEYMRDPKKELLLLQNYTRPTTEWGFFSYNTRSLPVLLQILTNQFENTLSTSLLANYLQLYSQNTLEKLFEFLGIKFEIEPLPAPVNELNAKYEQFKSLLEGNIEAIDGFEVCHQHMAYIGVGRFQSEELDQAGEGFIGGGFLS